MTSVGGSVLLQAPLCWIAHKHTHKRTKTSSWEEFQAGILTVSDSPHGPTPALTDDCDYLCGSLAYSQLVLYIWGLAEVQEPTASICQPVPSSHTRTDVTCTVSVCALVWIPLLYCWTPNVRMTLNENHWCGVISACFVQCNCSHWSYLLFYTFSVNRGTQNALCSTCSKVFLNLISDFNNVSERNQAAAVSMKDMILVALQLIMSHCLGKHKEGIS